MPALAFCQAAYFSQVKWMGRRGTQRTHYSRSRRASAPETERPSGALIPKGPSHSHARIFPAGIAASRPVTGVSVHPIMTVTLIGGRSRGGMIAVSDQPSALSARSQGGPALTPRERPGPSLRSQRTDARVTHTALMPERCVSEGRDDLAGWEPGSLLLRTVAPGAVVTRRLAVISL